MVSDIPAGDRKIAYLFYSVRDKEKRYGCPLRKKIFITWPTRAAKTEQNLLYRHAEPNEPAKEEPFQMYSLSPHLPQFQQSAGATPL
jgi:hypothetical protein